ncbi:MAG: hypothetical protein ACK4MF_03865 [Hyphomicrobiaceae bacterium]
MTAKVRTAAFALAMAALAGAMPTVADADCHRWYGEGRSRDEHRARQEAILDANMKFNATKARELSRYGTASNLNAAIARGSLTMDVDCRGTTCRAVKTWCSR